MDNKLKNGNSLETQFWSDNVEVDTNSPLIKLIDKVWILKEDYIPTEKEIKQFNKEIKAPVYIFPKSEKGYIIMILAGLLFMLVSMILFCIPALIFSLIWTIVLLSGFCLGEFKKVDLEDVKFAKLYNVETTDQVEARYILTTAFMDRINNLRRIFNSKDIRIFFENNKMTIAIRTTKDLFEIGDINCSIHDFKQVNQFYEEITTIISFIEYFKLTNRTGL